MLNRVKRIAITGPESTGKSSLTEKLATHYGEPFVPEFAREYVESLNRPYNEDDILAIARGQLRNEEIAIAGAKEYLFCDTELLVTKVWSQHKYNHCHPWILEQIEKQPYDYYLLCDIDLPWEYDKQREHPHLRRFFFEWYKKELQHYGLAFGIVSGRDDERLQHALGLLNSFFGKK